jgi:hypothetical protein
MMDPMRVRPGWARFVTVTLLLCIGIGLVSLVLPEAPEPSGYYDGDEDDAAATPERISDHVPRAATGRPAFLPAPTSASVTIVAGGVSPPAPGQSQPPPFRSPPA